jgi:hypothetical protein
MADDETSQRFQLPTTQKTWIEEMLDQGNEGRLAVNRHVMEIYYQPLQVYYLKSNMRWQGEAEEVVGDFFRDRLARPGFFSGWQEREIRLRHWFLGAFKFFLQERARRLRRDRHAPLEEKAEVSGDIEREVDRAFIRSIVNEACRRTRALCDQLGLGEHWEMLIRHVDGDRTFAALGAEQGLSENRAKRMARTARSKFRSVLLDLLAQDGLPRNAAEDEINKLLEIIT